MNKSSTLDIGKRVKAIADIGLLYTSDHFDRERYRDLQTIGEKLIAAELNLSPQTSANIFIEHTDYPTPKVDVRALVLNDQKEILMVREKADGCWSLPGGWADIGKTASEVAVEEVFEETGVRVTAKYLSAVFDKRNHPHPPQPYYVYKMVFYCEPESTGDILLTPAFDVLDVSWFSADALPPLSKDRILASQIEAVYRNIVSQNFITVFD